MSDRGRRVALLARPGVACDRLRTALADAGAQVVLEADPLTLDPAALDAARAQVVMVALDAQTEEALERFEIALQDPAIEVIFEEAELAAKREGWEAARWVRHLAAKLHRHGDVLPPSAESVQMPASKDASEPSVLKPAGGALLDFAFEADASPPATTTAIPAHAFDPLLAEYSFDEHVLAQAHSETPAEGPTVGSQGSDAPLAFDTDLDFSYGGSFDPAAGTEPAVAVTSSGLAPFDFTQTDDTALDDGNDARVEPQAAPQDSNFNQMFDGDFAAAAASDVELADPASVDLDAANPASLGNQPALELVSTDDGMPPALRGYGEPSDEGPGNNTRFKHDLASLESRIAGMELVDDRITKGPAQAPGAVLVMAGIGGPDAVRQLLGALPADFPRPVLVQQRLDGGRYDKLVAQMQRATTLVVKLAAPGLMARAGVIYILPANVGIQPGEAGIQFCSGDENVLAALPSADSAVLMLSGSDPAQVDAAMNHSWAGALVFGQATDGCYDAAAPNEIAARGGDCGYPNELARRLAERWRS